MNWTMDAAADDDDDGYGYGDDVRIGEKHSS